MSSSRMRGRAAIVAVFAGSVVLLAAVPAFAHVTVQPASAAKGSYSTVAFKVPNEQDTANTVKVEVNLPTDHPIASVSLQPVPGWTAQVTTSKPAIPLKTDNGTVDKVVTKITWSGGKIAPGEFQQFPVSFEPLPADTDTLSFKALQTYDNGQTVRWIEVPQPGAAEPQNPAPTLTLTAAATGAGAPAADPKASAPAGAPQAASASSVSSTSSASSSDTTARTLGIAGIAVGALGVAFGVFAGRRRTVAGAGADSASGGAGDSAGTDSGAGAGPSA